MKAWLRFSFVLAAVCTLTLAVLAAGCGGSDVEGGGDIGVVDTGGGDAGGGGDAEVTVPTCESNADCDGVFGDLGPCRVAVCNARGECENQATKDYISCDDGDICTTGEYCLEGVCTGARDVSCNDGNACTRDYCDPVVGGCVNEALTGNVCDDGDPCTSGDVCLDGVCEGTAGEECPCQGDADCAAYEDDDLCNGTLFCDEGQCRVDPATRVTCDTSGDTACSVTVCQPETGACVPEATPDGTACDDGNACTTSDSCAGGVCVAGTNQCQCQGDADCADFEDGDLCNGTLVCVGNQCVVDETSVVSCEQPADPCQRAECRPDTGACVDVPRADGTACDDGDACTVGDRCVDGACGGTARPCDDGDACTVDACDAATGGCTHAPIDCDDGDACTTDRCDPDTGACTHEATVCDDGDPCTADACDPATGDCVFTPAADGTVCDDGSPCTVGDVCTDGVCVGAGKDCEDDDPCTIGACDPDTGDCEQEPVVCEEDDDPCTVAVCDAAAGGCTFVPSPGGTPCDDGDVCTTGDACLDGACVGEPIDCDDGDPCTIDACGADGCLHTAVDCDDGVDCTLDACDPDTGACVHDASACPTGEVCDNGEDDDDDGLVDCDDALDCADHPSCQVACEPDALEDDDSVETATAVTPDASWTDLTAEYGDDDFFAIPLCAGGVLTVTATFAHDAGDIDMYLEEQDGTARDWSYSGDDDEEIVYAAEADETLWLRVTMYDDGGCNGYDLSIALDDSGCGGVPEDCFNGVDDDGDGRADCADSDCSGVVSTPGACTNDADLAIAGRVDVVALGEQCILGGETPCLGDAVCITDCIVAATGLSEGCASCGGQLGACVATSCILECADTGSDACAACIEESCFPAYAECFGVLHCDFEYGCDDGEDDDGDGLVDCADPDCAAIPPCATVPEICDNEVDDDGDDLADCADPDCADFPACVPACVDDDLEDNDTVATATPVVAPYAAMDLVVQDGDDDVFAIDVCDGAVVTALASFTHADGDIDILLVDEAGEFWDGSDSTDDNEAIEWIAPFDGTVYLLVTMWTEGGCNTYALDIEVDESGCAPPPVEVCDNGEDDDGDELVDCADPDCEGDPACEPGAEVCDNGEDDDGDELVDCADPDCADDPACQPGAEDCFDGVDNDEDGLADCVDPDCSGTIAVEGACTNPADLPAAGSADVFALGQTCILDEGCLNDVACNTACVQEILGVSDGCAACGGELAACVVDACLLECGDASSQACSDCVEASCYPAYEDCFGTLHCAFEFYCDNGVSDDEDDLVDCADPDCADAEACAPCADDANEDDDDAASATLIVPTVNIADLVSAGGDEDWFAVEVCSGGLLAARATFDVTAESLNLAVVRADGTVLAQAGPVSNGRRVAWRSTITGTVYLRVTQPDPDGCVAYGMGVTFNDTDCPTPDPEICDDGIDNDGDDAVDCDDPDCAEDPACVVTAEDCFDGVDNDDDGRVDCADPDCSAAVTTPGACTNELDLPIAGRIDVQALGQTCIIDEGCGGDPTCNANCIQDRTGLSDGCATCGGDLAACVFDNCALPCSTDPQSAECQTCIQDTCWPGYVACFGLLHCDFEYDCADGLDDDGDGLVDCDDGDCAEQPACTAVDVEVCGDGADNDGDGLVDCEDDDCADDPFCTIACLDDDFENNDSLETAATLVAPVTVGGLVAAFGDEDWFAIPVCDGAQLDITARFTHSDAEDIDIYLYRPDGTQIAQSITTTDNERISRTLRFDGEVFLRVLMFSEGGCNAYDLDVAIDETNCGGPEPEICTDGVDNDLDDLVDCDDVDDCAGHPACGVIPCGEDDTYEDNDRPGQATDITPDVSLSGLVVVLNDDDWFRVPVCAGGDLEIYASFFHELGDIDVALVRGNGDELRISQTGDDDEAITWTSTVDGAVFVRVYLYDDPNLGATCNTYDLDVLFDDTGCAVAAENCFDDVDNDGDGRADCADPDCSFAVAIDGACTNPDDLVALVGVDVNQLALDCVLGSDGGTPCFGDAVCNTQCIIDAVGVSRPCAACGGDAAACAVNACLGVCLLDPESQACIDCIDTNCLGAYEDCFGTLRCGFEANCADGVDDEGDGLVDCDDPDCLCP